MYVIYRHLGRWRIHENGDGIGPEFHTVAAAKSWLRDRGVDPDADVKVVSGDLVLRRSNVGGMEPDFDFS